MDIKVIDIIWDINYNPDSLQIASENNPEED